MPDEYKTASDSFAIDAKKYTLDKHSGFLHLPIIAARVGILEYPDSRRYLSPEVLKKAIGSLDYVPVTKDHQGGLVTTDNIKKVGKGFVKAGSHFDGQYGRGNAIIQEQDLIDDVLEKRIAEASCGYKFKEDNIPGKNQHGNFDSSYTFIGYNHVSAVPKGRAGENVKFEIDKRGGGMGKVQRQMSGFKIGTDRLLDSATIAFDEDSNAAMDTMTSREQILMDKITEQASRIQTLDSSLTVEKESLKSLKKAQDSMVTTDDLNDLTDELLDVRQAALKIGLDCVGENDAHVIKQKVLEKLLPDAYKSMEDKKVLDNKEAVDAAYTACKQNMGFNTEVFNTGEALRGNKGHLPPAQNNNSMLRTLEQFPRH